MSSERPLARLRRGVGSGLAVIVAGPSGAGKSSVIGRVMDDLSGLSFSVSYTTRSPRPGEVDGADYHFVSVARFAELVAAGEFVEHVTYLGDRYGTSRREIEAVVERGEDVILNIDVEGARLVRRSGLGRIHVVYVFLVPSSVERLGERLRARGTENEAEIERRLAAAARELEALPLFDYLVINDRLEQAVDELRSIVVAERSRRRSETGGESHN